MGGDWNSDRLRESFKTPTVRLDKESLERLIELTEIDGVEVVDWQTKGTPHPIEAWGVLRVRRAAAAQAGGLLMDMGQFHRVFPRGVPADFFEVLISTESFG